MKRKSKEEDSTKQEVAKQVISPKRKYFVAGVGTVEASSVGEVQKKLTKRKKAGEVGDGNR